MDEIAQFARDYGLLIATVLLLLTTLWYAVATARMSRVMAQEQALRKRPILSFQPAIVHVNGWIELNIAQQITNIGFSYAHIDSAVMSWKPRFDRDFVRTVECDRSLPCQLAPGEQVALTFSIPEADLKCQHPCAFESAAELLVGRIEYRYSGLDGRALAKEVSWPGTVIREDVNPQRTTRNGASESLPTGSS